MSPEAQPTPQRILVLRLGSMGDIIHSMPAVASLRASFPEAMIGWVVEDRWSALLSTCAARSGPRSPEKPLVDNVHVVDTRAWRSAAFSDETWREVRQVIRGLRSAHYDLSIDIQGAIKSAVLGSVAGPRRKIGFAQPWESMATMFYDHAVQASGTHIADRNASLVAAVGATLKPAEPFPIPHDPSAEQWAEQKLRERGLERFAILNPGAGWGSKCWPAARFGELARKLREIGIASLINFGPGEEQLVSELEQASQGAAQGIACTLSELIALTRRATLFVGGDTGPLHLAVAVNTPSVALFGPTDPARNGPYGGRAVVVRNPESVTTYKRSASFESGLAAISVDQVFAAARQVMEVGRG